MTKIQPHPQELTFDIPKTQKAAVVEKLGGPVQIKEVKVKQPDELKPGEVLLKIIYCGVCHTDLHAMLGDWPVPPKMPLIGGHEGAGIVVAIGKDTLTDLEIGQRIGCKWLANSCLQCEFCREGYEPVCPKALNHGYTVDGAFQQFCVSYANHVTPIPKTLALDACAPYLCGGLTIYKGIKECNLKPHDWIVILGAGGGLGHLGVQYAHYIGLRVVGIDTGEDKRKLVKDDLGAEAFVDFMESKDVVAEVRHAADGIGPHGAVVSAANPTAYEQALDYLRPHGTLVAIGLPRGAQVKADVFSTVTRSLRVKGSYVGNRQDAVEAIQIPSTGKVMTHFKVEPLDKLQQVYEEMNAGKLAGRVVLDMWK